MNKYILGIDGMRCGMCEMHVEEAVAKAVPVKKAKASHIKNQLIVITEREMSQMDFENVFAPTGYRVTSFQKTEAVKRLFGWR
ncbi:MAG: hypothetical protein K6E59_00605 [Bacilli bacterium]|nr:hypothetical protein [Bacilli bacterium]